MPDDSNAVPRPKRGRPKNPAAMDLAKTHSLADLRRKHDEIHRRSHYSQDYRQADLFGEAISIKERQTEYRIRERTKLQKLPMPLPDDGDKPPTEAFGMVPVRMFARFKAKSPIHVYAALAGNFAMRGENRTIASVSDLVDSTGLHRATVIRAVRALEDDYWIETIRTGRANRYRALPWPEVLLRQEFAAQSGEPIGRTAATSEVARLRHQKSHGCDIANHARAEDARGRALTKTSIEASSDRGREVHAVLFGSEPRGRKADEDGLPGGSSHISDFLGRAD